MFQLIDAIRLRCFRFVSRRKSRSHYAPEFFTQGWDPSQPCVHLLALAAAEATGADVRGHPGVRQHALQSERGRRVALCQGFCDLNTFHLLGFLRRTSLLTMRGASGRPQALSSAACSGQRDFSSDASALSRWISLDARMFVAGSKDNQPSEAAS